MVKNFVRALVMSGIVAVLPTSTQALGAGEQGERFDFQQGPCDGDTQRHFAAQPVWCYAASLSGSVAICRSTYY
jgi:hypothetical protein